MQQEEETAASEAGPSSPTKGNFAKPEVAPAAADTTAAAGEEEPGPAPPTAAAADESQPQLARIHAILEKILELGARIEDFNGRNGCREYLEIEELLTRHMLELDNVETMGVDRVRAERRMAVVTAQTLLSRLEKKALPKDI